MANATRQATRQVSALLRAIVLLLDANIPVYWEGNPGSGKTSAGEQLAHMLFGWLVWTINGQLYEPTDIQGIPALVDDAVYGKRMRFFPMELFYKIKEAGIGCLIIDEFSDTTRMFQSACLRVVLEKIAGLLELGVEIRMFLIGNPAKNNATGMSAIPAMANRVCHVYGVPYPNLDDKLAAEAMGWPAPRIDRLPLDWDLQLPRARQDVARFLRANSHYREQVPDGTSDAASRAYPTDRSWTMLTRAYAAWLAQKETEDVLKIITGGCVGDGPAFDFIESLRYADVPTNEEILDDPSTLDKLSDDVLYRALDSLAKFCGHAIRDKKPEAENIWVKTWAAFNRAGKDKPDRVAIHAKALTEMSGVKNSNGKLEFEVPTQSLSPKLRQALEYMGGL